MNDATDDYRGTRADADRRGGRLVVLHDAHLACRPGCHDCCAELTVSAVEYAAILADLRAAGLTAADLPPVEPGAACSFLAGGLCGIYPVRPLICRTHGLPVAFRDDADDASEVDGGGGSPPGVSVSFCPKNFAAAGPADLDFGPDNTLDLDGLNANLTEANLRYLREQLGGPGVRRPTRVPLKQLRQDLRVPGPPPAAA